MDGRQKLPQRLVGPIRDRLAAGQPHARLALGVAAWMRYVSAGVADDGTPFTLDDPLAVRLRAAVGSASTPAAVATACWA